MGCGQSGNWRKMYSFEVHYSMTQDYYRCTYKLGATCKSYESFVWIDKHMPPTCIPGVIYPHNKQLLREGPSL